MRAPAPPAGTSDTGRMRAITPPATPADTGRMRAPLPPAAISDTGRMRALAPAPRNELPVWTQESPSDDDFASVAAQARMGVQRKAVDEVARRKKQRLITAGAVAAAVAGVLVFLIEKFYDPDARAREQAVAAEVTRMDEERKFTDNLMLIEIDIENAIMENNLDVARQELAKLVEKSPAHPRREFLQASIDRAAELTKLSAQNNSRAGNADPERPVVRPAERSSNTRLAERTQSRPGSRPAERTASTRTPDNAPATGSATGTRSFGAPLGEAPRQRTIPLDAPMNTEPTAVARTGGSSFGGRTIEASDSPAGGSMNPSSISPSAQNNAGSAAPPVANIPAPASPTSTTDVVPAKIIRRVAPVAPAGISARQSGFVVVKFNIATNGRVGDVEVVESSPTGVFDDAARAAVRKWMYEPRKENGAAVESSAKARLVFEPAN
jgi:TonB family protein